MILVINNPNDVKDLNQKYLINISFVEIDKKRDQLK